GTVLFPRCYHARGGNSEVSRAEDYHNADDRICANCTHWAETHFDLRSADHDHMWCTCTISVPTTCFCGCAEFAHNGLHGRGRPVKRGWCHKHGTCPDHEPTVKRYRPHTICTCFDFI